MRPFDSTKRLHDRLCGALIALLLFAQGAVVVHQSSIEKHSVNHHCEICLLDAELHGANLQAAPIVAVAVPEPPFVVLDYRTLTETAPSNYSARAPPSA